MDNTNTTETRIEATGSNASPRPRLSRRGSSSPAAIECAERERQAIVLRREGLSYEEIAEQVGFRDRSGARKAVERGLGRWMRTVDEELRALELERLDRMGQLLWPMMESEDTKVSLPAMETYLRVMNHRAKITGLYNIKPQRHEVVVSPHELPRPQIVDDVHRFMVLTNQIAMENSAGFTSDEPVEATSYLDDHDSDDLD